MFKLSAKRFTKLILQELKKSDNCNIQIIDHTTITGRIGEYDVNISTERAYAEYLLKTMPLKDIIKHYTNAYLKINAPLDTDKSLIFPIIRTRDYLNNIINAMHGNSDVIYKPFAASLVIFYAFVNNETTNLITTRHLINLSLTNDEMHDLSLANMKRKTKIRCIPCAHDHNIYTAEINGVVEPSLLLLDIWNHNVFHVRGNIIVGIPTINNPGYVLDLT